MHLLPQLEQAPLWQVTTVAYDERPNNPFRLPHLGMITPIKTFACLMDDRQFEAHDTHQGLRALLSGSAGGAPARATVRGVPATWSSGHAS